MKFTDEQREEAAQRVAAGESPTIIAKDIGTTARTVNRWARDRGVSSQDRDEKTEAARASLAVGNAEKRERLRALLLDKAVDLLERMDSPHIDFKGANAVRVEWDTATSGDTKNYATAAAILIDKYRLEMGEATGRMENVDLAAAESRVDVEIERLSRLHDDVHS